MIKPDRDRTVMIPDICLNVFRLLSHIITKKSLLICVALSTSLAALSQTDTAFWLAAPEVSSMSNFDRPIVLRITSSQQPCTVTISQPAAGGMPTQTFNLSSNSTRSVDLTAWIDFIECRPGNVVQNKGIRISSTANISAYYEVNVDGPNPETFVLKGTNALGNEFYISSQNIGNNGSFFPTPYSSFTIVATEDNTTVRITPTSNIVGHAAAVPFTVSLNKGQTYAAIATSQFASGHLGGSNISSSKPVSVTLSDDLLNVPVFGTCSDLVGDQTIPTRVLGNEYIAVRGNLTMPYDKLFITATGNGTTIFQDGASVTTLNAGQTAQLNMTNPSTYVRSSLPVYAYQLSGIGCEMGSAILPPITCTGSSAVTFVRSTPLDLYITLLVKNGAQSNFSINGNPSVLAGNQFSPVPGTSNQWQATKVLLPISNYPLGSTITVSNSLSLFHLGVLQGNATYGTGFGYFSNFQNVTAHAFSTTPLVCEGSTINLSSDTVASASYKWTGPNGFSSNLQHPAIGKSTVLNAGKYYLTLTVPNCGSYTDSVTISVTPAPVVAVAKSICQGETYLGHSSSGIYTDTLIDANGCTSIRTLNLSVLSKSYSTITQVICQGQSYLGRNTTGKYNDTLVAANGCDSIRTLNLVVGPRLTSTINQTICRGQSYLGHNTTGTYSDTLVTAGGCDSIRILNLTVKPGLAVTINQTICKGQSYLGHNSAGTYTDTLVSANGCDSVRTLILSILELPNPDLGKDQSICTGDSLMITPGNFSSYLWQDNSSLSYYVVKRPGIYTVTVTSICGSKQDEILITEKDCDEVFPNAFTPNNDGKNDHFKILNASGLKNYTLAIYNRWGQRIFLTTDFLQGWDGKFHNNPQEAGAYIYYCRYSKNGINKFKKGTLMLIR